MANWRKCTTPNETEVRVNMDLVALVRPHRADRGGRGSEIVFAGGASSIIVTEDQQYLTGPMPQQ